MFIIPFAFDAVKLFFSELLELFLLLDVAIFIMFFSYLNLTQ